MADLSPYPGTPRWVKVFGIIFIVLVLLFVILLLTRGPHRPGRHTSSGDAGGHTSPSSVTEAGGLGGHMPPSSVTEHGEQQP
ncbi:MAG: hypothetical protein ACRDFA_02550 [bacterium]